MQLPKGARSTVELSCDVSKSALQVSVAVTSSVIMNRENSMRISFSVLCMLVAAQAGAATPDTSATHLCLAPPSARMPGVSSDDATTAVREAFKHYLTGPSLGVNLLTAPLASQAREEAQQKHCRYVLYTTVTQERKKSSGLLGRIAAGALQSGASQVAANTGSAGTRVFASAAAGGASST